MIFWLLSRASGRVSAEWEQRESLERELWGLYLFYVGIFSIFAQINRTSFPFPSFCSPHFFYVALYRHLFNDNVEAQNHNFKLKTISLRCNHSKDLHWIVCIHRNMNLRCYQIRQFQYSSQYFFTCRLRDYQLEGLNWMLAAWCKNNSSYDLFLLFKYIVVENKNGGISLTLCKDIRLFWAWSAKVKGSKNHEKSINACNHVIVVSSLTRWDWERRFNRHPSSHRYRPSTISMVHSSLSSLCPLWLHGRRYERRGKKSRIMWWLSLRFSVISYQNDFDRM